MSKNGWGILAFVFNCFCLRTLRCHHFPLLFGFFGPCTGSGRWLLITEKHTTCQGCKAVRIFELTITEIPYGNTIELESTRSSVILNPNNNKNKPNNNHSSRSNCMDGRDNTANTIKFYYTSGTAQYFTYCTSFNLNSMKLIYCYYQRSHCWEKAEWRSKPMSVWCQRTNFSPLYHIVRIWATTQLDIQRLNPWWLSPCK